jgi:hypothetical protein
MASGSSSAGTRDGGTRSAWQRHLFDLPEASLTDSQSFLVQSTERIENALRNMRDYQSDPSAENLILEAFCELLTVPGLNRTYYWLPYYYSPNTRENMGITLTGLSSFGLSQIQAFIDENTDTLAPKKLVDLWLATAVVLWLQITRYVTITGEESNETDVVRTLLLADTTVDILATYNPAFQRQYDEYLASLGVTLGIGGIMAILKQNQMSLLIAGLADVSCPLENNHLLANFKTMVQSLTEACRAMQDHMAETPPSSQLTRSGDYFVRVRHGKVHLYSMEFTSWDFQFRRMSFYYVHKIKADKSVKKSNPIHKEWWKATELYLNLIRRGIKEATEESNVDWYCVAILNRQLLTAMLSGVAKTVSAQEIEKITNEMKAAAEKCKEWAPPEWKTDIEEYRVIVNDKVLPFLRTVNPSSTAAIDVFTPGYLKVFEKMVDCYGRKKVCAVCGKYSDNLLRCGAVS